VSENIPKMILESGKYSFVTKMPYQKDKLPEPAIKKGSSMKQIIE